MVTVRWYLRYCLSYRDIEELLAERGIRGSRAGWTGHCPTSASKRTTTPMVPKHRPVCSDTRLGRRRHLPVSSGCQWTASRVPTPFLEPGRVGRIV